MSEPDKENTNQSSPQEREKATQEKKAPESSSHIFERLDRTLTKAASEQSMPGVVRIPRKPVAAQDQSAPHDQFKVVSLKRRSTKLMPVTESTVVSATVSQEPVTAVPEPVAQNPEPVVSEPAALTEPPPPPPPPPPAVQQPTVVQAPKIDLQQGASSVSRSSMLPLIDRMEQQINKVTSNLMTRVDQALAKLEEAASSLEKNGLSKQEHDQTTLEKLFNKIAETLDYSAEDAQGKLLDKSSTGQRAIQSILEAGQTAIDQQSKESMESLLRRSKGMRIEHGELTQTAQKKFTVLVKQRANDVQSLIGIIRSDWEKLTASELQGLEERDARANELVSKETNSINSTFDQYCQSLERDLDEGWEQSSYEVNLTRKQCIAAVDETLKIWQQRLILLTKSVIDSDIVPRLKELRDQLNNQVEELKQQFSMRNETERSVQMNDVETEITELKRHFRALATDAETAIYDTITEQQETISQLFIAHREDIQSLLRNAEDELESMHTKLKKSDAACRKLLISSAASLGLSLATEREKLISSLQELRRTTMQSMDDRLHQDMVSLEEADKKERSMLGDYSVENARAIKQRCKTAIAEIQVDVEQAFQEIQKSREKFLQ